MTGFCFPSGEVPRVALLPRRLAAVHPREGRPAARAAAQSATTAGRLLPADRPAGPQGRQTGDKMLVGQRPGGHGDPRH